MSASFHNSHQEISKLGNFMNCQNFSPKFRNSREFPPGIFEVADSREFPNGNSRWPCWWPIASCEQAARKRRIRDMATPRRKRGGAMPPSPENFLNFYIKMVMVSSGAF